MIFCENKKAKFNYQILEKFEAGIKLLGSEVKSIRNKKCKIEGSYVVVKNGEVFLIGALIFPYQNQKSNPNHQRTRKLLLKKKEIEKLSLIPKGLTIIPTLVYSKNGKIKIEIAIAKFKKKIDKRELIKKKEIKREIQRMIKNKIRG